jgi:hypothetical protein
MREPATAEKSIRWMFHDDVTSAFFKQIGKNALIHIGSDRDRFAQPLMTMTSVALLSAKARSPFFRPNS